MADHSVPQAHPQTAHRRQALFHAIAFVGGFSSIFIIGWGGAATLFGRIFSMYKTELGQIGGVVVIVFGLVNLSVIHIPYFYCDTRPQWDARRSTGFLSSVLMGIFFAAGWTPCIGTTLGAILTLGFTQETIGQAMWLSSGYALGLGIPFLIIGLGVERFMSWLGRFRRHMRTVRIVSGVLLMGIGLLLLTRQMSVIAIWAQSNGLYLDLPLGGSGTPSYLVAIFAGLLSFLSPCVLPLVPAYMGYLSGHAVREQK
ncbi:MAG: cytochrome c biogenesis protein CcdA [Anaerolineae bacterium]|nr:cytochrome c biogenesis protein CcdA [Anaerolineae bacterium]